MLRQLSSSHDNGQSMEIYHISLKTCTASCLRLMTTDKAWLYIPKIRIMPHKLSSSHDNDKSMITPLKYESCSVSCHHLMTTVRAWLYFSKVCNMLCQVSTSYENGQSMEIYHSCMKHAHAYDNGQSMVIHFKGMKHAPSIVFVSWLCSDLFI